MARRGPRTTDLESHLNAVLGRMIPQLTEGLREVIEAEADRIAANRERPIGKTTVRTPRDDGRLRGVRAGHVDRVLGVLVNSPGLEADQIQERTRLENAVLMAVLTKLRTEKKIKTRRNDGTLTYFPA